MVSEYAPPEATQFLSYITGKHRRSSGFIDLLLLIFYRLANLFRLAGCHGKLSLSRRNLDPRPYRAQQPYLCASEMAGCAAFLRCNSFWLLFQYLSGENSPKN